MKLGLNTTLRVEINHIDVDLIERVEFIFKRLKTTTAKAIKTASYPEDVKLVHGLFYIPWTSEETYQFAPDETFFMDTRITLKDTSDQPMTNIVELRMCPTLFEEGIEND